MRLKRSSFTPKDPTSDFTPRAFDLLLGVIAFLPWVILAIFYLLRG